MLAAGIPTAFIPTDAGGDTVEGAGANPVDASSLFDAESLHDARIKTAGKITANERIERDRRGNVMSIWLLVWFKTRAEGARVVNQLPGIAAAACATSSVDDGVTPRRTTKIALMRSAVAT